MKKVLLTSTCAAAISVFAAWTFSGASYAQQTQNTGASQQETQHKTGAESKEMKPGATKAGGAMNGAANENKEGGKSMNAAEQQNTETNKAGATNRGSTAEQKGQTEKGKMQSGEANHQERMKSGQANKQEEKTQTGQAKQEEKTHTGATGQKEPMRSGEAGQKEHMKSGTAEEKGKAQTGAAEEKGKSQNGAAAQSETSKSRMQTGETSQKRATEGRAAAEPGNAGATGHNEAMAHGKMKMNAQQASDFRSRLEKHGEVTKSSVNFNVNVGVAVPESVRLEPIPTDIIAEYPEFRGYDVVMVEDEIVIVDPHTREVVEVIGGSTRSAEAAHRERLRLTREQDEV
ncbi:MAG TPA: DUF1236 domain-containing protein, partial [Roseiarcus sp.]|nr:DUF1236 domain-containing protein [Roseiarcus sp.]